MIELLEKIHKKLDIKPPKKPAWEVVMSTMCPKIKRPRRTSLHTLATVLGHPDPLTLAKEMEKSGKVLGYVCPDVQTPIFYLDALKKHPGMINTPNNKVWGDWGWATAGASSLAEFFKVNPYPKIKGFRRFAGSAGYAMEVPYEAEDYDLARLIIAALAKEGYECGMPNPDNKTGFTNKEFRIFK
jgi:hypothetical protein